MNSSPLISGSVGVAVVKDFTDEKVREIIAELPIDTMQFHGSETEEFCQEYIQDAQIVKTISMKSEESLGVLNNYSRMNHFLLDTYSKLGGGSGKTFNWDLAIKAKKYGHIILAGGLNADNIKKAIENVQPYGVDISSGVEESPGKKDHNKLKQFFKQAR